MLHIRQTALIILLGMCGAPAALAQTCGGMAATIIGTDMDDDIVGTAAADVIVGLGGNDRINGLDGDDLICGDDGDDDLLGDDGNDRVFGGAGNDVLEGGPGSDECDGTTGTDSASDDCEQRANFDTFVARVSLETADGIRLDGALYVPDGAAGTRPVAMIVSHGAMGTFDASVPKILGLQAAPLGYVVLALNRRDFGETGGGGAILFEDATLDIGVGIDLLQQLGYDEIYIAGHSQGTQNAAIYPSFTQDARVVAVGLYGTVDDGRDTAQNLLFQDTYPQDIERARQLIDEGQGDVLIGWPTFFGQDLIRTPNNFLSFWGPDTLSVVKREIAKLEIPALLLRADGDDFTPDAMSQNVIATANATGVDATYVVLDYPFPLTSFGGNAHGFVGVERELMQTTHDWLAAKVPQSTSFTTATRLANPSRDSSGNVRPFAYAVGDTMSTEGAAVRLTAAGSFDLDGEIVAYQWQQVSGTAAALADSSGAELEFEAPAVARETLELFGAGEAAFRETLAFDVTVTDDAGGTDTARIEVMVVDATFGSTNGSSLGPAGIAVLFWLAGALPRRRRQGRSHSVARHGTSHIHHH